VPGNPGREARMKYKKVRFNTKRIVRLYQAGKNVSQIAQAIGYPPNCGNNRTRIALEKAGVYKQSTK
jgi:hypothetical protein